jgi:hypothetical protein
MVSNFTIRMRFLLASSIYGKLPDETGRYDGTDAALSMLRETPAMTYTYEL